MSTTTETAVFTSEEFLANAKVYRDAKRIVDAASSFESVDDAIAALKTAWGAMEAQIENGGGFTPPTELGFGSDNAAVIGESILGRRNTVGATRKAFNLLGNK